MSTIASDRLKDELAKYEQAREQLATQLERIERAKAQALAQLNACVGAVQALTALLPSEDAPTDTDVGSADAVSMDAPAPEPAQEKYTNGRA